MINPGLVKFIKEARRRGFSDPEIRAPLEKQGWADDEIDKAFLSVKSKGKIPIHISIDENVYKLIEKRAKRNLLSLEEQIQDIIRRSAVTGKGKLANPEKIDDLLVSIFSRKRR